MSEVNKTEQLEQSLNVLKIRVFDLSEALGSSQEQIKSLETLLTEIVKTVGLETSGDQITYEAILEKIKSLVPEAE